MKGKIFTYKEMNIYSSLDLRKIQGFGIKTILKKEKKEK